VFFEQDAKEHLKFLEEPAMATISVDVQDVEG
jgi:hypothetical protein